MLIDADLLLNFQRCQRRTFLDRYGHPGDRGPASDYLQKILQDSEQHRRAVLASDPYAHHHTPQYAFGDWAAGMQATQALMAQGVDCIHRGVVLLSLPDGITLKSQPDLFIKQPGESVFGDWLYVPVDVKLGKRPKLEYQLVAAFHTYVLSHLQEAWPEEGRLILRERGDYPVDLWDTLPQLLEVLDDCAQILLQQQEPEVFISRSRCSLCHWFNHCYAIAQTEQHLSLLPGVTANRYTQLVEHNLTTVRALADISPRRLEGLPGFGPEVSKKLVRQARATLQNRAILTDHVAHHVVSMPSTHRFAGLPVRQPSFLAQVFPVAPVELYFDIEAEPSLNLVYLHGVLVVDQQRQTETFYPCLAEHQEEEAQVWEQLLALLWQYPDAPIYHFCPFEVQTVERLGNLYHTPRDRIEPLLHRFMDLHEWVTHSVTLPVESYALKSIARWVGFDWRDPNANGAQSIYWYAQWLETRDRTYLDAIVTYNEDDCRATYAVKTWLVGFLQQACDPQQAVGY